MVNKDTNIDIEKLYQRYQETRDDIPATVLQELLLKAEAATHEDSIHSIIQAAKVANFATDSNTEHANVKDTNSNRLVSFIKSLFNTANNDSVRKPAGFALACLAIALVVGPMLGDLNTQNKYPETEHLNDCSNCGHYISNALATTRSSLPGLSKTSAEDKFSAKLGIILARLEIEAYKNSDLAIENARNELSKQSPDLLNEKLQSLMTGNVDIKTLSDALEISSLNKQVSNASKAIFIANISVRYAQDNDGTIVNKETLDNAISSLDAITSKSELQSSAAESLRTELLKSTLDLPQVIKKLERVNQTFIK